MSIVLLIDDTPITRDAMVAALSANGFEVRAAASGADAVVQSGGSAVSVVALVSNGSSGAALLALRKLRDTPNTKRTPVVLLADDLGRDTAAALRALGPITIQSRKRSSLADLIEVVRRLHDANAPKAPAANAGGNVGAPRVEPNGASLTHMGIPVPAKDRHLALKPIISRSDLMDRVESGAELRAMPSAVMRILAMAADESFSLPQVAEAVAEDHAISLRIMRLANSPLYSGAGQVDTLQKALLRIGLEQTRQIAIAIGVLDHFGPAARDSVDPLGFWEHSITVGVLSAALTEACGGSGDDADAAYVAGLFHDVGRMIFDELLGDDYARVVREARALRLPLSVAESRMLLVNHAELMDRVLLRWKFPRNLVNPIAFHHVPVAQMRRVSPRQLNETIVLALADRIAHATLRGDSGCDTIAPTAEYAQALGLRASDVLAACACAEPRVREMKQSLIAAMNLSRVPNVRERALRDLGAPVRPLFIGVDPGLDAWRMLCDAIRSGDETDAPNVAIVHIEQSKDRAALSASLLHAERAERAFNLPLLILSPTGDLTLDEQALEGRRHARLPSTLTLGAFIDALNGAIAPGGAAVAA